MVFTFPTSSQGGPSLRLNVIRHLTVLMGFLLALLPTSGKAQMITVREVASSRGSVAVPFGTINDMVAIGGGRVVISDDVNRILHVWTPATGAVAVFARTGDGPGEVRTPTRLAPRPGGGFALYDAGASAIFYFDAAGKPDGATRINGIVSNPKSLAIDSSGHIWISGGRLADQRQIHVFAPDGRRVAAYGDPSPYLKSEYPKIQAAGGALRNLPGGGMLFSWGAPLRIVRFAENNPNAAQLVVEDRSVLGELREQDIYTPARNVHPDAMTFHWWHDRTTAVFVMPDGRLLNVITRYNSGTSDWLVYSSTSALLGRVTIPGAYHPFHRTPDGRVLATYKDPDTDESVAVLLDVLIR